MENELRELLEQGVLTKEMEQIVKQVLDANNEYMGIYSPNVNVITMA